MSKSPFLSAAFGVGGVITIVALILLQGFGQAEAGMSAGGVQTSRPSDTLMIFLICAYFFTSAFGIYISKARLALWLWALVSHALLVIVWIVTFMSIKNGDPDGYEWPHEMLTLSIVMLIYFLPWMIAWGVTLFRKGSGLDKLAK